QWVIGVEGDVVATNLNGARPSGFDDGLDANGTSVRFSPAFFTSKDKTNWQATATARLGYSWGRTLFYGKAGVAFEDDIVAGNCIWGRRGARETRTCLTRAGRVTGGFSTPWSPRVGWTAGLGTEFALGRGWSAKSEYDFLSFDRHNALATDGTTFV